MDVEYFPFDEQTCVMKFGSWTYDGFQVKMMIVVMMVKVALVCALRTEYLRNNGDNDDDDRNIYLRNEYLRSVIDIKEDDQWDTGESSFIMDMIMMIIFQKMTNDDMQVDLRS